MAWYRVGTDCYVQSVHIVPVRGTMGTPGTLMIATTQATVDGVIDPVDEWVQADGDHGRGRAAHVPPDILTAGTVAGRSMNQFGTPPGIVSSANDSKPWER